jgi:hypothetical protein
MMMVLPHLEENSGNEIISRIAKDSDRFHTSLRIDDNLGILLFNQTVFRTNKPIYRK